MSVTYKIPFINPIRFHQSGVGDFFYNEIPDFEVRRGWAQPYVMGDRPFVQIHCSSPASTMLMSLMDNAGTVYKTWSVYYSGYTFGTGADKTYLYNWTGIFPAVAEGFYFLKLLVQDSEGYMIFYSEPIRLYTTAPDNHIILRYTHDENDFGVVFVGYLFMMRLQAGLKSEGFQPGGKFTMYQDLDYQSEVLTSQPYNVEKWTFGSSEGIPNWVADKINRLFGLSTTIIDATYYCRNEGAKMERQGVEHFPLAVWQLELIKKDNPYEDTFTSHDSGALPLTCDSILYTCDSTLVTSDMTEI